MNRNASTKHCQWEGLHVKDKSFLADILSTKVFIVSVCERFQIQLICSAVVFYCQSFWHLWCTIGCQPADHIWSVL